MISKRSKNTREILSSEGKKFIWIHSLIHSEKSETQNRVDILLLLLEKLSRGETKVCDEGTLKSEIKVEKIPEKVEKKRIEKENAAQNTGIRERSERSWETIHAHQSYLKRRGR